MLKLINTVLPAACFALFGLAWSPVCHRVLRVGLVSDLSRGYA
jgi:hypothetical protein